MLFVQLLMLTLVVVVWVLLYYIWREVEVFFTFTEQREEAPPQSLDEIVARSKSKR